MSDHELSDAEYLRDLAKRLREIPVIYGTDDGDIDRLYEIAGSIPSRGRRFGLGIPKEVPFPEDAVQCDDCGGTGRGNHENVLHQLVGCLACSGRGWLRPKSHTKGRHCANDRCDKPLPPDHVAVYCSNRCAQEDA